MPGKLVSIDLGTKYIHLVCGRHKGDMLEICSAVSVPAPEGAVRDGRIEDIHNLKTALKYVFQQNKIKNKRVSLTVQSTSIITRDILLPAVKPEELKTMVKYEIEQYLPIVASEYVIEYNFVEEVMEEGTAKSKLRVAAMPAGMVENYFMLLKECGLKPAALDIHANCVGKLFSNAMMSGQQGYSLGKTNALMDLGHNSINVHILSNGKVDFSRIITLGGRDIDAEIAVSFSLTSEKAEDKKMREGRLDLKGREDLQSELFNDILRSKIDIWINEIQKIFQYYISRNTGNRIDEVHVFGGTSRIKGICEYLERGFNIRTKKLDALNCVTIDGSMPVFTPDIYINALGGMIRYE